MHTYVFILNAINPTQISGQLLSDLVQSNVAFMCCYIQAEQLFYSHGVIDERWRFCRLNSTSVAIVMSVLLKQEFDTKRLLLGAMKSFPAVSKFFHFF